MGFFFFALFILGTYFLVKFLKKRVSHSLLPYYLLGIYLFVLLVSIPIAYLSTEDEERSTSEIQTDEHVTELKTMLQSNDLSEFQAAYETVQAEDVTSVSFAVETDLLDLQVFISEHTGEELQVFNGPLLLQYAGFEKIEYFPTVDSVNIDNGSAVISLNEPSSQYFNIVGGPVIHGNENSFHSIGGRAFMSNHVIYLQVPEETEIEVQEGQFINIEYVDN